MNSIITVTSEAVSRRLIEPSYARAALGWTTDDISDAMLSDLIDGASLAAENWLGRRLIEVTVEEMFLLDQPVNALYLSIRPVWATPAITVTEGTTLLASTDWRIDYQTGRLTRVNSGYWPRQLWGFPFYGGTVTVAYRGGYTSAEETGGANVPPDLRDGVLEVLQGSFNSLQQVDASIRSEEVPGAISVSYATSASTSASGSIPASAIDKLRPYRNEVRFG